MKCMLNMFMLAIALSRTAYAADTLTVASKELTLDGAKRGIAAAVTEAKRLNAPGGAIAVVDTGGYMIASERLDNTFAASAVISVGKARTSALFRKPSGLYENIINKGRTAMATLPDSLLTPLQGGVPIEVGGKVVGAIGVSGAASAQQDEEISIAAVNAVK